MDIFSFRDKHQIITYWSGITSNVARDCGTSVIYDGELVGYYLEDGYQVISVPMASVSAMTKDYLWHVVYCLVVLNIDKSVEVLTDFMYLYIVEFTDTGYLKPEREYIQGMVDYVVDKADSNKCVRSRKFFFIKSLDRWKMRKIVISYVNKRKSTDTLMRIENVIEWLTIEANEFITPTTVKEHLDKEGMDMSLTTVKKYMELKRDEIDRHNRKIFGTDKFAMYRKMLSIHNIKEAIEVLSRADESLSRRKVADTAGVHFNTVQNLWMDEEIQEQLNKFNQAIA